MTNTTHFAQASVWIGELEDAVSDVERALRVCDWEKLDAATDLQPRLIHGLRNALEVERPQASPEQNREMNERVDRIIAVRASQIERLKQFRDEVQTRLIELAHFRKVAREASAQRPETSTFNVTR